MTRRLALLAACLAGACLAGACLAGACLAGLAAPAHAADPVTIGVSSRSFNPGYANMWIGIPLGLYGPTLAPSAVGTAGITENLQLMLSGRVTMSTGTQDVILAAAAEGRTLPVVIPCVYLRGMIQRVEVLEGSPIGSYQDLKGKRIGVPTLAVGQVPYVRYAERSLGVDPADIRFIAVGNGQPALAALTSGQVDALANTDVDVAGFQALHAPIRVLPQPETMQRAAVGYAFVFARSWYDAHKTEAAALLQGMIKAVVVILENPEAAVRISYHMHPESIPAGIPLDQAVREAVTAIKVRAPSVERQAVGSDRWCEFSEGNWRNYADMLGLHGKVDAVQFYTGELIDAVNDFDEPTLRAWARSLAVPEGDAAFQDWAAHLHAPD